MLERENSSAKTPLKSVLAQACKEEKATVSLKAYNQLHLSQDNSKNAMHLHAFLQRQWVFSLENTELR